MQKYNVVSQNSKEVQQIQIQNDIKQPQGINELGGHQCKFILTKRCGSRSVICGLFCFPLWLCGICCNGFRCEQPECCCCKKIECCYCWTTDQKCQCGETIPFQ